MFKINLFQDKKEKKKRKKNLVFDEFELKKLLKLMKNSKCLRYFFHVVASNIKLFHFEKTLT